MLITLESCLPCSQYQSEHVAALCGTPTGQAIAAPLEDGVWELVPVCLQHLADASLVFAVPTAVQWGCEAGWSALPTV